MAADVCEVVFSEKDLWTGDVVGEDDDEDPPSPPAPGGSTLPELGPSTTSSSSRPGRALARSSTSNKGGASKPSAAAERRRRRAAERATKIVYWLETKYDILHEVCSSWEHWKEAPSAAYDFDILWCDTAIPADRFMKLKQYQKMNHFVGMSSITRKNNLGRNLLRMRKQFPKEYKFFPDTWILPTDLSDFKSQFLQGKTKTFIVKPDNGCQGRGIFLIRDVEKVPVDFSQTYVAQRYISKPFLLDGFKFDLRLYVLVLGCDPLRIFIHKRGLVRLASEEYVEPTGKNLSQQMVHLTNYAVNKMNPNFEENTDPDDAQDGHKRSWEAVQALLRKEGHDVDKLLVEIEDLIVKTLIAVQPSLSHFYHSCQPDEVDNAMCFEVLGFDVMLDHKLQPWLLEVNHAPSFQAESELDRVVKEEVLKDTFRLLNLSPEARRQKKREAREKMEQRAMGALRKQSLEDRMAQEKAVALERTKWEDNVLMLGSGYTRLYPSEEKEQQYMHVHDAAVNIWEMLMGGTSRRPVLLQEREEEKTDGRKGAASKDKKEEEKTEGAKEKRTKEELQEVVDRLTAGCSARPRGYFRQSRKGAKEAQNPAPASAGAATEEGANILNEVVQEVLKPEGSPPDSRGDAEGSPPATERAQQPQRVRRSDVQVGDVIKVQTNLGWEMVTITAKRVNGKLDIEFKDGEYMRSVLPRILREEPDARKSISEPSAATGSTAASSGGDGSQAGSSVAGTTGGSDKQPQADGPPEDLAAALGGCSPRKPTDGPSSSEDALHALDQQVSAHLRTRVQKRGNFNATSAAAAAAARDADRDAQVAQPSAGSSGRRNERGSTAHHPPALPSATPFQLQQLISVRPLVTGSASSRPPAGPHETGDRSALPTWSSLITVSHGSGHRAGSLDPRHNFGRRSSVGALSGAR